MAKITKLKLAPPAARRYAELSSGTRLWLNGFTTVSGQCSVVVLIAAWLKEGGGWRERVLQFAVATLCSDALCFADDDFGEEGGRAIARMLERNSTLKSLSIWSKSALASMSLLWFAGM